MAPKRKATSGTGSTPKKPKVDAPGVATRLSSRSKSLSSERSTDAEDAVAPMQSTKAEKAKANEATGHWEIVGKDSRDALVVGVPEPHRLVLTLRNTASKETKTFKYRKEAEEVDWDDPDELAAINKYRHTACTRHKLPLKVVKFPWTPYETAFLELMYQKLQANIPKGHTSKPHENKILESFNNFFENRTDLVDQQGRAAPARLKRDKSSFTSYVNRPSGSIRALRDLVKDELKDQSAGAWIPDITDAEIETHLKKEKAKDKSKGTRNATSVPTKKAITKQKTKPLLDAGKNKPNAKPNASANTIEGDKSAPIAPTASDEDTDMPDTPKDPEALLIPSNTNAQQANPTAQKTIEELKAEGFLFYEIPKNNKEAIEQHRDVQNKKKLDSSWNMKAITDLDARLEKRGFSKPGEDRDRWSRDNRPEVEKQRKTQIAKKGGWMEEDWHKNSAREGGAAAVNGLLNAAILPPLGYTGHIRDLVEKRQLPEGELILAQSSEAAIRKVHSVHDRDFKVPEEKSEVEQRDLNDDSSETGGESVDEEA
jgi:hypothetical protein